MKKHVFVGVVGYEHEIPNAIARAISDFEDKPLFKIESITDLSAFRNASVLNSRPLNLLIYMSYHEETAPAPLAEWPAAPGC